MKNLKTHSTLRLLSRAALCMLIGASAAYAGERSVMNQAGAYEQTMRFYLHPAHGFPGAANNNGAHPAVLAQPNRANASGAQAARRAGQKAAPQLGLAPRTSTRPALLAVLSRVETTAFRHLAG